MHLQSGSWKVVSDCFSFMLRRSHFLSRFFLSSSSCLTANTFFWVALMRSASSKANGSISLRMVFKAIRLSYRILVEL